MMVALKFSAIFVAWELTGFSGFALVVGKGFPPADDDDTLANSR